MALRVIQTRDENAARHLPHHGGFKKPEVAPRAALGSIGNHMLERNAAYKAPQALKKPLALRQPLKGVTKDDTSKSVTVHHHVATSLGKGKSPEPEEMEVAQMAEALTEQLQINDIDAFDADNPQLCAEYVKEIYEYMKELEVRIVSASSPSSQKPGDEADIITRKYHVPPTYMQSQPQVNAKMRTILIDWLIQVHLRFHLLQETLYLTVSIIDRFLQISSESGSQKTPGSNSGCKLPLPKVQHVDKSKLQLVGVTAMLIASKYEEMYAPEVNDFVIITDKTYTSFEIQEMERKMLQLLDYSLGNPLCLHFLRRYSRAGDATSEIHTMAKFLMELCLPDYTSLQFLPSQIAAAALHLALKLHSVGDWSPTLQHYSGYSEEDILPCTRKMAKLVMNMHSAKQQAVRKKYSENQFFRSNTLRSQVIKDLSTK